MSLDRWIDEGFAGEDRRRYDNAGGPMGRGDKAEPKPWPHELRLCTCGHVRVHHLHQGKCHVFNCNCAGFQDGE